MRSRSTHLPWHYRLTCCFLIPIQVIFGINFSIFISDLKAVEISAAVNLSVRQVQVNQTSPDLLPFKPNPRFSNNPSDVEIETAHTLEEPLIPQGPDSQRDTAENQALAQVLISFPQRQNVEDLSLITRFLDQHPLSRWKATLELNLGLLQYQTGHLTKALASWADVWDLTQHQSSTPLHSVADRAFGEMVALDAKLGRTELLKTLFAQTETRTFFGSAAELVFEAKQGYHIMQVKPSVAFKCGPFALDTVRTANEAVHLRSGIIEGAMSTSRGTSLAMVKKWSEKLKMRFQIAKRASGSAFIVPAVMHWKLGHFAALVRERNGRYLIQDPTFGGSEIWISPQALEEETSGYYLVPEEKLPPGWILVSDEEASTIWGRGGAHAQATNDTTPSAPKTYPCVNSKSPMTQSSSFSMLATLHLEDTPLRYQAPFGPQLDCTIGYTYNEANQPANYSYSNFGYNWVFQYVSFLTVDSSQNITVHVRGGGTEIYNYSALDNVNNVYAPDPLSQAQIYISGTDIYKRVLPDGSYEVYSQPNGTTGQILLKQIVDPQGNAQTIIYDANYRIASIKDVIGQLTLFTYASNSLGTLGFYKVAQITDPYGRHATFAYDATNTYLTSITDVLGIQSKFTYDSNYFIDSLTTPYGRTTFQHYVPAGNSGANGLRINYPDHTFSVVENYLGHDLNTYYWDRRASPAYPDPSQASITHWLQDASSNVESSIPQYTKQPLEGSNVSFTYAGNYTVTPTGSGIPPQDQVAHNYTGVNNKPSSVSRILDNGHTQHYYYSYNALGNPTSMIDPLGRVTTYLYDGNNIDLLQVRQNTGGANDLLARMVYNNQHEPLLSEDGSGQTTHYTYNAQGQILTVTDPKFETMTLNYNTNGYLQLVQGPLAGNNDISQVQFNNGQVLSVIDSEGYKLNYNYDTYDRPVSVTFPDSTTQTIGYVNLDAVFSKDRLGNISTMQYDVLRQLVASTDPNGRTTKYSYCTCGGLASLTDGSGNVTSWSRDVQGRPTLKTFADGHTISYGYEANTSRLKSMTDAQGQITNYSYNDDDTLTATAYTGAVHATSAERYTYDTNYQRILTATNGWGTTSFTYNPYISDPYGAGVLGAGQVSSIFDSAQPNSTITFIYDQLGRATGRNINETANPSTVNFDAMGRVNLLTNLLGTFTPTYVDQNGAGGDKGTTRLAAVTYPNGQTNNYSWYGSTGDERLQQINNLSSSGAVLSQFNYAYDARGEITSWQRQADSSAPTTYANTYDPAGQLIGSVLSGSSGILHKNYFHFDQAGNRTAEQRDSSVVQTAVNNLNQITQTNGGGATRFQGTISQPGTVTINGTPASMSTSTSFVANPVLTTGTNTVTVVAKNGSNLSTTNHYSVNIPNTSTFTPTFDLSGNETSNGNGQSYAWDAENRLITITYTGGATSNFTYDALGHRVQIVEKNSSGTVTSTIHFIWCGSGMCEERDASNNVTKRLFDQGQINYSGSTSSKYYYTRDHLGSVREVTDSTGTNIVARYDYDPFGRVTLVQGSNLADVQYAGYYAHQPSSLNLTLFRAYDPNAARWLSRDPLGEGADATLYSYVGNDPINLYDSLGLFFAAFTGAGGNTVGNADLAAYAASQGGKAYDRTQAGQDQAAQDYQAALAVNPSEPLNVAGYSRGTEAANNFAKDEGKLGHCVDHLILIDPVSKFGLPLHLAVPSSVKQADDYYQTSGGPFQGGPAQPGPNVTNHDVSGPGVNHNTVVSTVVGGR